MTGGRGRRLGARLAVAALLLWFAVPLVPVLTWAFANQWSFPALLPQQWGLRGWAEAGEAGVIAALGRSILLGTVVAILAVALGTAAGRALAWGRSRWNGALALSLFAPVALPPFARAMGLDVLLLRLQVPSLVALVGLLTVFALPYTTYTMRAAYTALDRGLEEQARLLGASPATAFFRVTLPALAPAVAAATFLAFLVGWSDYVVTVVISGGQFTTVPLLIGSAASRTGNEPSLAVLSLLSLSIPLATLLLAGAIQRRRASPSAPLRTESVTSPRKEPAHVG
ncbi:MAG: ABC transporter permease subunit [Ornithinimicrobium sp.]